MSDYFIFDDIDTRNYEGISVYFDEVDTTPKRVGEFIEIPNRNGSLFLDSGRYEDVTHTYDIIALSMQNGRNLINALASKVGHHRLQDSFNPTEYYSAVFDTEVIPTATMERDKITFKVMFTRKPQRFLTSGETATTVANNGTLTNPTAYASSPLLAVKGYGTITFNGYSITVDNATMGEVVVANGSTVNVGTSVPINTTLFNRGDYLTVRNSSVTWGYSVGSFEYWDDVTVSGDFTARFSDNGHKVLYFSTPIVEWDHATNATSSITHTGTVTFNYYRSGVPMRSYSLTPTVTLSYNSSSNTITASISGYAITLENGMGYTEQVFEYSDITVNSSISILGNPTYIDCDLGEAYMIKSNEYVSLNRHIDLGSDLPTLKSGSNTFTKPSTITELKVTPRWWQL